MDGFQAISPLRKEPCCARARFIAISGFGQDEDRQRTMEAGFRHHLVKHVDQEALDAELLDPMKHIGAFFVISTMFAVSALAGDDGRTAVETPPGPFDRGMWELEAGAGGFGSFSTTAATRKTIDYEIEDVRVGWMYDSPRHNGLLRGNNEFLAELFCGPVVQGPGTILGGGAILWRYNFVQPDAKLVPYLQLGGGAAGNDIYHNQRQREIGEDFEFVLQGDLGLKYLISDQWSVSTEADYRHISNADLSSRNEGLNSIGGLLMMSYVFH